MFLLLFHTIILVVACSGIYIEEEKQLRHFIRKKCPMHSLIRTVENYNDTLKMNLDFVAFRLLGIENYDQRISMIAEVDHVWHCFCCRWDNIDRWKHIQVISYHPNGVYKPSVVQLNNAESITAIDKLGRHIKVDLFRDGTMKWTPLGLFISNCNVRYRQFPFDTQTCQLIFEPWNAIQFVEIENISVSLADDSYFLDDNDVWYLEKISSSLTTIHYEDNTGYDYSHAVFTLKLSRRPFSYTLTIFLPSVDLMLLQVSCFLIPPDHPDRSNFSITVLLASAVLQSIINQDIPSSSELILIVVYLSGQVLIGLVCTIYSVIMCRICYIPPNKFLVSKKPWVPYLDFFVFSVCLSLVIALHLITLSLMLKKDPD